MGIHSQSRRRIWRVSGGSGVVAPPPFTWTKSISLNGTDQSMTGGTGINSFMDRLTPWSITGFIKPNSLASTQYIWDSQQATADNRGIALFFLGGGGNNNLYLYYISNYPTGNYILVDWATPFTVGVWQRFIVAYSGSGTAAGFSLRVAGSLKTKTTHVDGLTGTTVSTNTLVIGKTNAGSSSFFNGLFDEKAFWTADKSGDDATIFPGGLPTSLTGMTGLKSWWRFEDTPNDEEGVQNLTLVNSPSYSTDVPA